MSASEAFENTTMFTPLKIGNILLQHRVIMAPLTRCRSPEHIPDQKVVDHYSQRATPGGLLIAEGTHISTMAGNYPNVPGVFAPEHRRAWKKVVDAVHAKGGYIFCQLWHAGRCTHTTNTGGRQPLAPSEARWEDGVIFFTPSGMQKTEIPQAMTEQDIKETVEDYAHAARVAIDAGFDGVEIHGANGFLIEQFICSASNHRTDSYGGTPERRGRFVLEVVDAVAAAVGERRVGLRLSPFGLFQGVDTEDHIRDYGYVVGEMDKRGLAYVHFVEPRFDIMTSSAEKLARLQKLARERGILEDSIEESILSMKPFRDLLKHTPMLTAGGYSSEPGLALEAMGNGADGVVFGRAFIANPDLVERVKKGLKLAGWNRDLFYTQGREGYTDYPTYEEGEKEKGLEMKPQVEISVSA